MGQLPTGSLQQVQRAAGNHAFALVFQLGRVAGRVEDGAHVDALIVLEGGEIGARDQHAPAIDHQRTRSQARSHAHESLEPAALTKVSRHERSRSRHLVFVAVRVEQQANGKVATLHHGVQGLHQPAVVAEAHADHEHALERAAEQLADLLDHVARTRAGRHYTAVLEHGRLLFEMRALSQHGRDQRSGHGGFVPHERVELALEVPKGQLDEPGAGDLALKEVAMEQLEQPREVVALDSTQADVRHLSYVANAAPESPEAAAEARRPARAR